MMLYLNCFWNSLWNLNGYLDPSAMGEIVWNVIMEFKRILVDPSAMGETCEK